MLFDLSAKMFRVVHKFVSTEETEYHLSGVHVERHAEGAVLVATDGHRLLAAHDATAALAPDFPDAGVTVQLDHAMLAACKRRVKDANERRLVASSITDPIHVTSDEGRLRDWCIAGPFPDWQRIVPRGPFNNPTGSVAFNSAYLRDFSEVAEDLTGTLLVRLTGDGRGAHLVTFTNAHVFGVLMPLRGGTDMLPDWFRPRPLPRQRLNNA